MSKHTDKIDMRFKYTPAASTDITVSIRREQKWLAELIVKQEAEALTEQAEREAKVRRIAK